VRKVERLKSLFFLFLLLRSPVVDVSLGRKLVRLLSSSSFPPTSKELKSNSHCRLIAPLPNRPPLLDEVFFLRRARPPDLPLLAHRPEPKLENGAFSEDQEEGGEDWVIKSELKGGKAGKSVGGGGGGREGEAFDAEGGEGGEGGEEGVKGDEVVLRRILASVSFVLHRRERGRTCSKTL